MSAFLSSVPKLQFFDGNGNPLVGGKLYTYAAGTSTPLATYTDSSGATPNTNPIILDSRGEANVWLTTSPYKFELKTAADALIWTVDNVSNALNLSQLLASSGSAANPPYTFAADPTTGMYLGAVGQVALTANGNAVLRATDTAMTLGSLAGNVVNVIGELGVNTSAPDRTFHVRTETASTNTVLTTARFETASTGTPADGIGAAIELAAEVSAGVYSAGAVIGTVATSVASSNFDLTFSTTAGGVPAEHARITSAGFAGFGTTAPATKVHIQQTSAATNTVIDVLRLDVQSSGTPANGIGVGLQFAAETTVGNTEVGAQIHAVTTDVTAGSEDFDLVFSTMAAGAAVAERARIRSDGYVGIGTAFPMTQLHVQTISASTNDVGYVLRVDRQSSGTPANGIGTGIIFATETNTTAFGTKAGATIESIATDVTGGSEDFDLSFKLMTAGALVAQQARLTSTGLWQINSGFGSVATVYGCRAWINFDGTLVTNPGTLTGVRGSGNVASVTDNGAGDYTVTFTNAMPDANYTAVVSSPLVSNGTNWTVAALYDTTPLTTGSARVVMKATGAGGGGNADTSIFCLSVFR